MQRVGEKRLPREEREHEKERFRLAELSWTLPTTDCENPAWHRIDISKLHELRHLSGL